MATPETHPDIFTASEAATYLHLDNASTLEWLRDNGHLTGHKIGKAFMYHRDDLDACAKSMFGKSRTSTRSRVESRAAEKLSKR